MHKSNFGLGNVLTHPDEWKPGSSPCKGGFPSSTFSLLHAALRIPTPKWGWLSGSQPWGALESNIPPHPKMLQKDTSESFWEVWPLRHLFHIRKCPPGKKAALKCGLTSVNSFSAPKFGPDHSLLSFNALMLWRRFLMSFPHFSKTVFSGMVDLNYQVHNLSPKVKAV